MAYATAAPDLERLPWLKDERKPSPASETPWLLAWGTAGILLVAAASYWIGFNAPFGELEQGQPAEPPTATVRLPEPAAAADSSPEVSLPPMPEVKPVQVQREVKITPPRRARSVRKLSAQERDTALPAVVAAQEGESSEPAAEEAAETKVEPRPLTYWPASESENAYGRVVRIGTFSTRLQAKRAWWKVVKVYPGMKGLKAVVAPVPSYRDGRTYYRLQFGTTSQAHSEILCQRMRVVGVSCTVVGVQRQAG